MKTIVREFVWIRKPITTYEEILGAILQFGIGFWLGWVAYAIMA